MSDEAKTTVWNKVKPTLLRLIAPSILAIVATTFIVIYTAKPTTVEEKQAAELAEWEEERQELLDDNGHLYYATVKNIFDNRAKVKCNDYTWIITMRIPQSMREELQPGMQVILHREYEYGGHVNTLLAIADSETKYILKSVMDEYVEDVCPILTEQSQLIIDQAKMIENLESDRHERIKDNVKLMNKIETLTKQIDPKELLHVDPNIR